jgi:hypothetical protein
VSFAGVFCLQKIELMVDEQTNNKGTQEEVENIREYISVILEIFEQVKNEQINTKEQLCSSTKCSSPETCKAVESHGIQDADNNNSSGT